MKQLILLISGKRKCGKDFLASNLKERLKDRCQIVHISEPIKAEWAQKLNLNLKELLSDGPYKELYRKDMIAWSDSVREQDYGYFCRKAMNKVAAEIIIVSDIRRKNDIKYFKETFGARVRTIRLTCPEFVRIARGWVHTVGVDDVQSECDLDDYMEWDLILENNGDQNGIEMVDLILNNFHL